MELSDRLALTLMLSLFLLSLALLWTTRPTPQDIQICLNNSSYSHETCMFQLMR